MDVVQGFVLTAAAPCTGLCAERRKSLKPFGRGVYAKRVRRVRPMHLRGSRWSPEVVAGETGGAWRSQRGQKNPICDIAPRDTGDPSKPALGAEREKRVIQPTIADGMQ